MEVSNQYVALRTEYLAPILLGYGFKANKKADLFQYRTKGFAFQVSTTLISNARKNEALMNVGVQVAFPPIWKVLSAFEPVKECGLYSGAGISTTLLMLTDRTREPTWRWLDGRTHAVEKGPELVDDLKTLGLPFLQKYSNIHEAMDHWGSEGASLTHAYPLAIAHYLHGNLQAAVTAAAMHHARVNEQPGVPRRDIENAKLFSDFIAALTSRTKIQEGRMIWGRS